MSFAAPTSDAGLRARARQVVPGGLWGHLNADRLPAGYPQYFERGEGCRIWDVDGRQYLDFMCSWGPIVVGHQAPEVDAAARGQQARGDCLNGPAPVMVELAERLVQSIPHADWALFCKNGTDATTSCVTIARAATRRRKILVARGAYHGAVPWCSPSLVGVTAEDRVHVVHFEFNDENSLHQAATEAGEDLAAILVSAFRHDIGIDHEMPRPSFARLARALCDTAGAALIVDDVRAGFRLHRGGSWEAVGVKPDLSAWSKAIANGYPLAAVTGNDRLRDAAASVFLTGSFWCAAVPMAAALATLAVLDRDDGVAHMAAMGQRLRDGLASQARAHGIRLIQSGPPQLPFVRFANDADFAKANLFCRESLARGVYLHPRHTMFLSLAHHAEDIDRALLATDDALAAVARKFDRD